MYIVLLEANCGDDSDDNNGVITALATVMVIAVIGLVISIVINVFLGVKLKQSRCVVTSMHFIIQLQLTIYCRYNVYQSNIRYSDVKQSESRDHTITNPAQCKPTEEPEYEAIENYKTACDVKTNANPAYHSDAKLNANPAYQATSQLCSLVRSLVNRNKTGTTVANYCLCFPFVYPSG